MLHDSGGVVLFVSTAVAAAALVAPATARADERAASPTWSPDGAEVAYAAGGDLYAAAANGSGRRSLTRGRRRDAYPAWGPDGRLAYVSVPPPGSAGGAELRALRPGGAPLVLAVDVAPGSGHAWSPDGAAVAYTTRQGEIAVVHAETAERRLVARGHAPAWSPDGRRLVYVDSGLHVVGADGSGDRRLTSDQSDNHPAWSPDGAAIAFTRLVDLAPANREVFVVEPDTGAERRLTFNELAHADFHGSGFDGDPAWRPDGGELAFTSGRGARLDLWAIRRDGTGLRRITDTGTPHEEGAPAWSPDGRRLAFEIARPYWDLDDDVGVANADGTGRRNLTFSRRLVVVPAGRTSQSRNRRWLAFKVRVLDSAGTSKRGVRVRVRGRDVLNPHAKRTRADGGVVFLLRVRPHGRVTALLEVTAGRMKLRTSFTPRL